MANSTSGKNRFIPRNLKLKDSDYLSQSKFGGHLQSATIGDKLKALCNEIGLTGIRIGSHTLRKTWAFHQWKDFGVPLVVIMRRLNPKHNLEYDAYLWCNVPKTAALLVPPN